MAESGLLERRRARADLNTLFHKRNSRKCPYVMDMPLLYGHKISFLIFLSFLIFYLFFLIEIVYDI